MERMMNKPGRKGMRERGKRGGRGCNLVDAGTRGAGRGQEGGWDYGDRKYHG